MRLRLEMTTNKQAYHNRTQHQHGLATNSPRPTYAHKRNDTRTTQTWVENRHTRIVTPPAKKTSPKTVATLTFPRYFPPVSDPPPQSLSYLQNNLTRAHHRMVAGTGSRLIRMTNNDSAPVVGLTRASDESRNRV